MSARTASRLVPGAIGRTVQALLATTLALFAVEVLVNLSVHETVVFRSEVTLRPSDLLGLLIADAHVALLLVMAGGVVVLACSRILRVGRPTEDLVVVVSAALSAATLLSSVERQWSLAPSSVPEWLLASLTLPAFWILIRITARRHEGSWGISHMIWIAAAPPLLVGFGIRAAGTLLRVAVITSGINGLLALLLLGVTVVAHRRGGLVHPVVSWAPVWLAIAFASPMIFATAHLGRPDDGPHRGGGEVHRPDIVLVILDTVRADHLRRYGYGKNTMPGLERWADSALVFTRAVSPAGWTSPAHASILTGRTVSQHGLHYGHDRFHTDAIDGLPWLPRQLADEGYYCLAVSANTLALPTGDVGFARTISPQPLTGTRTTFAASADDALPLCRWISARLRWRTPYVDAATTVAAVERALPVDDGPVFLLVNMMDAHSPYNPPRSALDLLGLDPPITFNRYLSHRDLTLRWDRLSQTARRSLVDLYDGELRGMDTHLAHLLARLETHLGGDATIIVTSDHGEELGAAGRIGHEYGLSQTLVHVPLLVRGPDLRPGERGELVTLRALHDYMLQLGRGRAPGVDHLARSDTLGVIAERYASGANAETLGSEYLRPWVAMYQHGYKGVGPTAFGFELFDVESSGFSTDVPAPGARPDADLSERIDAYWLTHRDRRERRTETDPVSRESLETLRSLGYVD